MSLRPPFFLAHPVCRWSAAGTERGVSDQQGRTGAEQGRDALRARVPVAGDRRPRHTKLQRTAARPSSACDAADDGRHLPRHRDRLHAQGTCMYERHGTPTGSLWRRRGVVVSGVRHERS